MERPTNAPGCFAAASVFAHDSQVCKACPCFDACASASLETLKLIRGAVNVEDLLRRHSAVKAKANVALKARDDAEAASRAPGNVPHPLSPVERKTDVVKVEFSKEDGDIVANVPEKTRTTAVRLIKEGIVAELRKRYTAGDLTVLDLVEPKWLRVALTNLASGGFEKSKLRDEFVGLFGWTPATAQSHVSMATALLVSFKFATSNGGQVVLTPASGA